MKYLIIILASVILCACNGKQEDNTEIHVHDENCIITEDLTCVNSDFYANTKGLTDSEITEMGGNIKLK